MERAPEHGLACWANFRGLSGPIFKVRQEFVLRHFAFQGRSFTEGRARPTTPWTTWDLVAVMPQFTVCLARRGRQFSSVHGGQTLQAVGGFPHDFP
jgi:hypothetical protein